MIFTKLNGKGFKISSERQSSSIKGGNNEFSRSSNHDGMRCIYCNKSCHTKRLIENFIRNHNVLVRMMASKDFFYLLILLLSIEYNMVYIYIREWCN